jgi:hypothetical protein
MKAFRSGIALANGSGKSEIQAKGTKSATRIPSGHLTQPTHSQLQSGFRQF